MSYKGGKKAEKSAEMTQEQGRRRIAMLKQTAHQFQQKMSELEMDTNEHKMVLETLAGVEPGRKCFRMVGGVLVERTVEDVMPAVKNNSQGIETVLKSLNEQFNLAQKELTQLQMKFGVDGDQKPGGQQQGGPAGYPAQRQLAR